MIIEITQQPANHRWAVHMDGWEASFDHLDQAEAFVRQLKARIEAPHVWPALGIQFCPATVQRALADLAR